MRAREGAAPKVPEHAKLFIDIPGLGDHQFRLVDPIRLLRLCGAAAKVSGQDDQHAQAAVSAAAVGWFWAHPEMQLESEWSDDPVAYGERISAELYDAGWSLVQIVGTGSALMRAAQEAMPSPEEVGGLVDFTARMGSQSSGS